LRVRACLCVWVLFGCSDPEGGGDRIRPTLDVDAATSDAAVASTGRDGGGGPTPTGTSCADVDCDRNATCDDRDGTAECTCNPGFTLDRDGVTCNDIDECATDNGGCDEHAVCVNRPGFRRCVCKDGFTGDGVTCEGTDECADVALNTCDPNATCTDAVLGFSCSCNDGTTGDGFGCADVDECADSALFECAQNASCKNTFGGYACECGPGFTGTAASCTSLCGSTTCDDRLCRVVGNAADCTAQACKPGFVGDGATCVAIDTDNDDCAVCDGQGSDDVPGAVCSGTPGAGSCTCAPGYAGTVPSCTDVDECATSNGGCGDEERFTCRNLPGGYACGCQPGWTGANCDVDVNECEQDPGPCHPNALCTNTNGGFICNCRPGYSGDGSVCRDVNECEAGTDNCLDNGTARCLNTAGSFECRCLRGYTGNGVTRCENLNECQRPELNDCAENAICTDASPADNPLGYDCMCPEGLGGDGTECTDVNECLNRALNDCARYSSCINEAGGYRCECQPPFAGDDPDACHCDLSGYWAMRQDVDVCWCPRDLLGVRLIAGGAMEATVWELHRYSYDGETLRVEKGGCGVDNAPDLWSPHFQETYSSYVPDETFFNLGLLRGRDVQESGIVPGRMFTTPNEAAVAGIDLGPNPETAPWPASFADINAPSGSPPRWVDTEGDGQLGLTLWPRVPSRQTATSTSSNRRYYSYVPVDIDTTHTNMPTQRAGCLSVATRVITRLEADVQSCNRIVGEVINVRSEGRVGACTIVPQANNGWIRDITCNASDWDAMEKCDDNRDSSPVQRLDDQDQQQQSTAAFELVKVADLGDSVDCRDVRNALPAFTRATPTPITCQCP
jgi:hypothetical protein